MFNKIFNRLAFMATFIAASVGMSTTTIAGGHQVVDSIHFLIPVAQEVVGMVQQEVLVRLSLILALLAAHPTKICLVVAVERLLAT